MCLEEAICAQIKHSIWSAGEKDGFYVECFQDGTDMIHVRGDSSHEAITITLHDGAVRLRGMKVSEELDVSLANPDLLLLITQYCASIIAGWPGCKV